MEEKKQVLGKIKSKMVARRLLQNRKAHLLHRIVQRHLKMSLPQQPNPGMEEKNVLQEEVVEDQAEGPKMWTPLLLDLQGPLPGGTENAPLIEVVTPPTTTASAPKAAEPTVGEEGSSMAVVVVTEAHIQPALGLVVAAEAELVAGVAETTVHLLLVATTRSQRVRGLEADMVRTGLSITQLEPGTEVKPAVRAQNMRKSLNEGGREAQRLEVRVEQVTLVTRIRKTTRKPRTVLKTQMPQPVFHPLHPEVTRLGSLPPEACPQEGAEVEVVEEETSTGVVEMSGVQLGDTGSDPIPPHMVDPRSHQCQPGSSRHQHKPLAPKTWAGEQMVLIRKIRLLMEVQLRVRGPILHNRLCLLQRLLL